jgi:hypothetical protein
MTLSFTQPIARLPWIAPEIIDLPALKNLTLVSGGGIPGGDPAPGSVSF